ncbi:hypothetical protein [Spirosoma knui]
MHTDLTSPLSPLQVELLKAFAMPTVDENDLVEIRKMLSQYFARKASMQAQQLMEERRMAATDIDAIAHQHNRVSKP